MPRAAAPAGPSEPPDDWRRQHVGASLWVREDGAVALALRVAASPSAVRSVTRAADAASRSLAASPPESEVGQARRHSPASHDASAELADALFAAASTESRVDGLFSRPPQAGSHPLAGPGRSEAAPPAAAASPRAPSELPSDLQSDFEGDLGSELHQLLFLVHGIGPHADFKEGQFLSWDGSEGMAGGGHEFRSLLEGLLGGRRRDPHTAHSRLCPTLMCAQRTVFRVRPCACAPSHVAASPYTAPHLPASRYRICPHPRAASPCRISLHLPASPCRLREVPLKLSVLAVEWHADLHRPEIDDMVAACSPEGVNDIDPRLNIRLDPRLDLRLDPR